MRPDLLVPTSGFGALTPVVVNRVLGLVGCRLTAALADPFSQLELAVAYDYAMRRHLRASDNLNRVRPRPAIVVEIEGEG